MQHTMHDILFLICCGMNWYGMIGRQSLAFQDPSGSLPAAVHHRVMADDRMSLARGAVVLLNKVGGWDGDWMHEWVPMLLPQDSRRCSTKSMDNMP